MRAEPHEPDGARFRCTNGPAPTHCMPGPRWDGSGRVVEYIITAANEDPPNWLCYRHPDGQWVTLREATAEDHAAARLAKRGSDSGEVAE